MALITNIHFVEIDDASFRLEFLYNANGLTTENLNRTATTQECLTALRQALSQWVAKRADDNFTTLQANYEGKSLNI